MAQTPRQDRHHSIDILRGFAVLGILMMNIGAFAMVFEAYTYPLAHMDMTGINATIWTIQHTFFAYKFVTIFSALFGAGVVLMLGEGQDAKLGIHYRRMGWLLLIGMIHAYVFWFGDILVPYALCGFIIVLARRMPAHRLFIWGGVLIAITGLLSMGLYAAFQLVPGDMDATEMGMALTDDALAERVALYQSGFLDRLPSNLTNAIILQFFQMIGFSGRLIGVMFVGMALFKSGFLTLGWERRHYMLSGAATGVLGVGLCLWASLSHLNSGFDLREFWKGESVMYVGSLLLAYAYAAGVMLLAGLKGLQGLLVPFRDAGRMAFTNYLTQTLIMTFIFVGFPGLGLFGTVERSGQFLIVIAVWALQLVWSPLWLARYRFGPLEWLWRSLTYGRFQPMRKSEPSEAKS